MLIAYMQYQRVQDSFWKWKFKTAPEAFACLPPISVNGMTVELGLTQQQQAPRRVAMDVQLYPPINGPQFMPSETRLIQVRSSILYQTIYQEADQ